MTEPHHCMYVGDDGTFRVVEFPDVDDTDTLDVLQTLVDGDIERVVAAGVLANAEARSTAMVDVLVNEDGWVRRDFKHNRPISALLAYPVFLVGPAVVTATDREGNTCGLPEHLIDAARDALVSAGAEELPAAGVEEAAAQQREARRP